MLAFSNWLWLFPVAITIHNIEEAIWLPAWSMQHALKFQRPVGKFEFRFAVLVLTVAAYLLAWLSVAGGAQSLATYLYCSYICAMFLNVFTHLLAAIVTKRYAPGLATALLLNLPVTAFLLWLAIRNNYVAKPTIIIVAVLFTIVLAGSLPLLFALGRKIRSTMAQFSQAPS